MPISLALFVLVALRTPATAGDLIASCAWVRAENDGAGSGFVIDAERKLLVTCRHIVADRAKVDVIFPWVRDGVLVTDRAAYLRNRLQLRERGLLVTGKVLKTSDEFDLALVELNSARRESVRSRTRRDRAMQLASLATGSTSIQFGTSTGRYAQADASDATSGGRSSR